jgi:hypothetical protein
MNTLNSLSKNSGAKQWTNLRTIQEKLEWTDENVDGERD